MGGISVVINTLNEENNLPKCLSSIRSLADEVVVVDMYSSDNTSAIAKKAGAKVYKHKKTGYVEPARNFAISKATGKWVLVIDADEVLSSSLSAKLKSIIKKPSADYYRLPRKNIIFGKWIKHSRWWPDYNIRFFKKGYVNWNEMIHSVPITTGIGADLEGKEELSIIHNHYQSVEQYIDRLNRYTSEQAKNLKKEGVVFKWTNLITKPTDEFVGRYFQAEGYKDGIHGLALAGLQGFSEFILYLKLWQMKKFREKNMRVNEVVKVLKEKQSDMDYWQADSLLKENGGLKNRVKRKFKLR